MSKRKSKVPARTVRHMDDIGARLGPGPQGEVEPGQLWFRSDTTPDFKGWYEVTRLKDDRVWLRLVKTFPGTQSNCEDVLVQTLGSLLSSWVLAREAPVTA